MRILDDTTVTINIHELRILTIWASNWADHADRIDGNDQASRSLGGILHRLRKQLPGVCLTLSDEVQHLADQLNSEVELRRLSPEGGVQTFKPKKSS